MLSMYHSTFTDLLLQRLISILVGRGQRLIFLYILFSFGSHQLCDLLSVP
jgi:hypothetical protein